MRAFIIAAALALTLVFAGVAQAMSRDEALTWGTGVARNDCDGGPAPWLCADVIGIPFPKARQIERCNDTSRWCVEVLWVQWDFTWPRTQNCVTNTHWRVDGVGLTYHTEGCIGFTGRRYISDYVRH